MLKIECPVTRAVMKTIYFIAERAPELDMNDYSKKEMEDLNEGMQAIWEIIKEYNFKVVGSSDHKTYQMGKRRVFDALTQSETWVELMEDEPGFVDKVREALTKADGSLK